MKQACDVCRALIRSEGGWPQCVFGIEVVLRGFIDGRVGGPWPAPSSDCPKPVTKKAFEKELENRGIGHPLKPRSPRPVPPFQAVRTIEITPDDARCPGCNLEKKSFRRLFHDPDGGDEEARVTCDSCGVKFTIIRRVIVAEYSVKEKS